VLEDVAFRCGKVETALAFGGQHYELLVLAGRYEGSQESCLVDVQDLDLEGCSHDEGRVIGTEHGAHETGRGDFPPRQHVPFAFACHAQFDMQVGFRVGLHSVEIDDLGVGREVGTSLKHEQPEGLLLDSHHLRALDFLGVPHAYATFVVEGNDLSAPAENAVEHQSQVTFEFAGEGLGEGEGGQPEEELGREHPGADVGGDALAEHCDALDSLLLLGWQRQFVLGRQLDNKFPGRGVPQFDCAIERGGDHRLGTSDFFHTGQGFGVRLEDDLVGYAGRLGG
jgi:hypothetical protein